MQEKRVGKNDVRETALERGCKGKKSWKEDVRQKELGKSCQGNSVGKRM